jgi:murein L,D-transpeptidase YcbB/YkuD
MLKNIIYTVILLLLTSLLTCTEGFASQKNVLNQPMSSSVTELIKKFIAEAGSPPKIILKEELIHASNMLVRFYKRRDFQPVWSVNEDPLPRAHELIKAIEEAEFEGLKPDYYHIKKIKKIIEELDNNKKKKILFKDEDLVALDLLLTDAFLMLGCHFSSGCVNPVTIEAEWFAPRGNVDVASVLDSTLKRDNIKESLKKLLPPEDSYYRLRHALNHYRKIVAKGGWQTITNGPTLKKGVKSRRVVELRKRLVVSDDLDIDDVKTEELFEKALEKAVLKFQKRHGLKADGIVGPVTLEAMNVPAEILELQ